MSDFLLIFSPPVLHFACEIHTPTDSNPLPGESSAILKIGLEGIYGSGQDGCV